MSSTRLKSLLVEGSPLFWPELGQRTSEASDFDELFVLSVLRRKAVARGIPPPAAPRETLRLAILGGCSLYPLHALLTHLLASAGIACELLLGDYDNYVAEIMEAGSALNRFKPEVVFLLPGAQRFLYQGRLTDPRESVQATVESVAGQLLELVRTIHERDGAEVVLGNFILPARHDLGAFRSRTAASDWNFLKCVNLELGLMAPGFVRICDLEFLAHRHGGIVSEDRRGWFESKQPCSPTLLVAVGREAAHLIAGLRTPPKKVLVLDLDNTLWGGVVADDGLEGIELGDTSPRGEAFKAFQRCIASLKERGVLLAVCSKNDQARAFEPFEKHPEMVLRLEDFVAFKANWEPKADNLRLIADELRLGLDSFVFVDDNPAEIEMVRQFAPAVATILLGADPADYTSQLQDCRFFEPHAITREDVERTSHYRAEHARQSLHVSLADMDAYLESLAMEAVLREFAQVDVPRLAQLINKSNQFNTTTRRRTEAEVQALIERPDHVCFSARLTDRFGDNGLISIVIGRVMGDALEIDTWLMSCRVLKRQVEDVVLNELVRLARAKGCHRIEGVYIATAKNEMVRGLYPSLGFHARTSTPEMGLFTLELDSFQAHSAKIAIRQHAYEST